MTQYDFHEFVSWVNIYDYERLNETAIFQLPGAHNITPNRKTLNFYSSVITKIYFSLEKQRKT